MNHGSSLHKLLATDPADVGCDATFALLDVYVEVELAGQDPRSRFPGLAAHLRSCEACQADYQGLLAAVSGLDG
jgi:hypothetical protein